MARITSAFIAVTVALLAAAAFAPAQAALVQPTQRNALFDFKNAVGAFPPYIFDSWVADSDCSNWNNIACDDNGNVIVVSFNSIGVQGTLPESFGNLIFLQLVDLSYNVLSGPLPSTLKKLKSLTFLEVTGNAFSGPIPNLGPLDQLQTLSLSNNQFTGPFPSGIARLASLTFLDLSINQLTGTLPCLNRLTALQTLILSSNKFSGKVSFLGQLTQLTYLALDNNQLTGAISSSLVGLTSLTSLLLNNNLLTGPFTLSLPADPSTVTIAIHDNYLSGPISITVGGAPFCADLSNNCLLNYGDSNSCAVGTQLSAGTCTSFCNAAATNGACGGHGLCFFDSPGTGQCKCDCGYEVEANPATCYVP